MSEPRTALTYADFWRYRGRQSFWLTRQLSYRLGAALALIALRIGLSPGTVTLLSFLTGIGGALLVERLFDVDEFSGALDEVRVACGSFTHRLPHLRLPRHYSGLIVASLVIIDCLRGPFT